MLPVPHAMPNKNVRQYERMIADIIELGAGNARLCDMTGYFDLLTTWVDDAIRQLCNISVFAEDNPACTPPESPSNAVNYLLAAAAGSDYGGLRSRKAKLNSYRRWIKKQSKMHQCHTTEHLRELVRDAIDQLRKLLG